MYKFLVLTLLFLGFVAFANPSFAVDPTRVRGNVIDQSDGHGIKDLTVTVVCNGITKTAVTNGSGLYQVNYTKEECGENDPVSASVTFNGDTQNQGDNVSDKFDANIDFFFNVAGVPEFGLLPGLFAAGASAGSYLLLKRKRA